MNGWLPVSERPARRRLSDAVVYSPLLVFSAGALAFAGWIAADAAPAAMMVGLAGASVLTAYRLIVRRDHRFRTLAIRADEAPMLPELGVPHGVLVALWVVQGHAVTGADRGAMWVEDGKLMFCGRRTSFVLTHDEAAHRVREEGPGELTLRLRRSTPIGGLGVSFTPLFGDRPYAKLLETTFDEWLRSAAAPLGASQLPPTAIGPGAALPSELRRRLGRRLATEIGFVGILAVPFQIFFGGFLVPIVALVIALFVVLVPSPELPALRDWRRLREEEGA